ncbi:MAG: N-acetyltransferase [Rhodobacteraceae bacterium]|nr:N-acetyltransferase [Paracoccaceae bacterium]
MVVPGIEAAMLIIRAGETDDAPGIARVHVESWQAAYRGIVPQAYLDSLTVQNQALMWARLLDRRRGLTVLVSEADDGRIVGFTAGGEVRHRDPRFQAEISSLYVMPHIQRQGHGTRLFMALSNRLAAQQLKGLFVWVLAENQPGRAFYEKCGGEPAGEVTREFAGTPLREIGYGWRETPKYG